MEQWSRPDDEVHSRGSDSAESSATDPRGKHGSSGTFPGTMLGRYILLEPVGSGGFGVVYKAYDRELDRLVALKLLPVNGVDGQDVLALKEELLREAQALAKLDHPNVVPVYDVGFRSDSLYIVMPFIDGMTLSRWCRAETRSLREIVRAFVLAGKGLSAAHDAGLVHRDFKAENVMVANSGAVKVLDFGVAKRLAPGVATNVPQISPLAESVAMSPAPAMAKWVGTPRYMAPEQHLGGAVDARTDQFAFCVVLYETLYGEHPFEAPGEPMSFYSGVMSGAVRPAPAKAKVPWWLRRALVRGLSREASARYSTMGELLAAIQDDPVRRWLQWSAVAFCAAALLALVLVRTRAEEVPKCADARTRLVGVWDDERRRIVRAAFTATRLQFASTSLETVERELDDYSASWASAHNEACLATRVRGEQSEELFDLQMQCLMRRRDELAARTSLFASADVEVVTGAARILAGLTSLDSCRDAAELRGAPAIPSDSSIRARVDTVRRQVASARALREAGKYEEGFALADQAREQADDIGYVPLRSEAYLVLGLLQDALGRPDFSAQSLQRASALARSAGDERLLAEAWSRLALVLVTGHSKFDEAERLAEYAEATVHRFKAAEDVYGILLHSRVFIALLQAHYESARELATREVEWVSAHRGERSFFFVQALDDLAKAESSVGQTSQSLSTFDRTIRATEALAGDRHPSIVVLLNNKAVSLRMAGRREEALECFRQALKLQVQLSGPRTPDALSIRNCIADIVAQLGDSRTGASLYAELVEDVPATSHVSPLLASQIYVGHAMVLQQRGEMARALPLAEKATSILERALAPDALQLSGLLIVQAQLMLELGERTRAIGLARRVSAIIAKHPEADAEFRAGALFLEAQLMWEQSVRRPYARHLAMDASRLLQGVPGADLRDVERIERWLAAHRV